MLIAKLIVRITNEIVGAASFALAVVAAIGGTGDGGLEVSIAPVGVAGDDSLLVIRQAKIDGSYLTKSGARQHQKSEEYCYGKPSLHFVVSQIHGSVTPPE
jgi:hypothetical protein